MWGDRFYTYYLLIWFYVMAGRIPIHFDCPFQNSVIQVNESRPAPAAKLREPTLGRYEQPKSSHVF